MSDVKWGERKRGRRYRSLESIRRGLSSVINGVEFGGMEIKKAAVMVQALNTMLATVTAQKLELGADNDTEEIDA